MVNAFLPGLDALALYGMIADRRPARYLEIGSGNSTKFAARAKRRHSAVNTRSSPSIRSRAPKSTGSATASCASRSRRSTRASSAP